MSKQQFRHIDFSEEKMRRIQQAQEILQDYPDQERLTARQIYYQFVQRGWLENNQKNYQNLTTWLTDARYAGEIDWDVIEDRGREPSTPAEWSSVSDLLDAALHAYRLPRWKGQEYYVELWVEKQALAGILSPLASRFHVTLMVNKGYSSASAMKESAERFLDAMFDGASGRAAYDDWRNRCDEELTDLRHEHGEDSQEYKDSMGLFSKEYSTIRKKRPILFYMGDHDPSGMNMVTDIEKRLKEFGVLGIKVDKLALTMAQIRTFNPIPNPVKVRDSRAQEYIRRYGNECWELDALPPNELGRIVERAFNQVIDRSLMDAVIAQEKRDKETLRNAVKKGL